jgi:DeoR/GlpR family transcriptional regulator of sugar metabolism
VLAFSLDLWNKVRLCLLVMESKLSREERQRRILETINQHSVLVSELVKEFGVSEMTIRRDLSGLEEHGKILRVHGGAIASGRLAYESAFEIKQAQNIEAKKAIGDMAAKLVGPKDVVFIDTGTTALAVARAMRQRSPRILITSNLAAALEFVGSGNIRILVTGGELSHQSPDLYGEWALQVVTGIHVDVAFFGCDAVDANGFYASDTRSAAVSRLMLSRSQLSYLVADSSKFGSHAMCQVANHKELTGIITDSGLAARYRMELETQKVRLILAE